MSSGCPEIVKPFSDNVLLDDPSSVGVSSVNDSGAEVSYPEDEDDSCPWRVGPSSVCPEGWEAEAFSSDIGSSGTMGPVKASFPANSDPKDSCPDGPCPDVLFSGVREAVRLYPDSRLSGSTNSCPERRCCSSSSPLGNSDPEFTSSMLRLFLVLVLSFLRLLVFNKISDNREFPPTFFLFPTTVIPLELMNSPTVPSPNSNCVGFPGNWWFKLWIIFTLKTFGTNWCLPEVEWSFHIRFITVGSSGYFLFVFGRIISTMLLLRAIMLVAMAEFGVLCCVEEVAVFLVEVWGGYDDAGCCDCCPRALVPKSSVFNLSLSSMLRFLCCIVLSVKNVKRK